mmetsp:Transcript_5295/g.15957  ORF Transcript_5295/g.15957 Transcript_5295/m.15957 type:complete len:150 (+) Transcript_5295:1283-1732(+)
MVGLPWGQFQGASSVTRLSKILYMLLLSKVWPIMMEDLQALDANIALTLVGRTCALLRDWDCWIMSTISYTSVCKRGGKRTEALAKAMESSMFFGCLIEDLTHKSLNITCKLIAMKAVWIRSAPENMVCSQCILSTRKEQFLQRIVESN